MVEIIVSISIGFLIYLKYFQRPFYSKSLILITLGIMLISFFALVLLKRKTGFLEKLKTRDFTVYLGLFTAVILSLIMLLNSTIIPLYALLPNSNLKITIPLIEEESNNSTRLLGIENELGYIHFSRLEIDGDWQQSGKNLLFSGKKENTLSWSGQSWKLITVYFAPSLADHIVNYESNGSADSINLNPTQNQNYDFASGRIIIPIEVRINHPILYILPFIAAFIISVSYIFFVLLKTLSSWQPRRKNPSVSKKNEWLLYMLPMLITWGFVLTVFWPGIMSNDSLTQWMQGISGQFNDWQSGFHALVLSGLMRVWYSPALVSILQILSFSLVVAWGLGTLQEHGAPRVALWGISLMFAVMPTNVLLSITIWKDIPYAIAFLWLTVMIVKIVLGGGDWISRGINRVWLGVAAFLVAIFRHNGAAVAAASLIILLVVNRKTWKPYLGAILVGVLIFFGVKGPLYSAIKMDRASTSQTNLIYLHHLAAHLSDGSFFEPQEIDYLDSFLPVGNWDYWCCYVGTISYNGQFERQAFLSKTTQNRDLALTLFKRDPFVDISHAFCAGEMAWKFENNECYMKSTHGISSWYPGEVVWIGTNDANLIQKSLIPGIVDAFVLYLRNFGFLDDMLVFWLRPAFWLYIGIFSTAVLAMRHRDARLLLVLLPALCQTVVLILVSFAPAFRYHYGTFLAGLFLLGLIFVPRESSDIQ